MDEPKKEVVKDEPKIEALPMIEQARQAALELRAANAERLAIVEREEKLFAMQTLGGKSEAGTAAPVESDQDRIKRETRELFKGTGLFP